MSIGSKEKNRRGHREFAARCRSFGFTAVRCVRGISDCRGLPGLSVEIHRAKRLRLDSAMAAAKAAAAEGQIPVVAYRSDRRPWRVTLDLSDFFLLYRAYLQRPLPDPVPPAAEAYHD